MGWNIFRDMVVRVRNMRSRVVFGRTGVENMFFEKFSPKIFFQKSVLGDRKSIPSPSKWRGFRQKILSSGGEILVFVVVEGVRPKVKLKKLPDL